MSTLLRRITGTVTLAATAIAVMVIGGQPASGAVTFELIRNANSGKCLDVADASRDNKAAIAQYTCDAGKTHQLWTLEQVGDGSGAVRIKAAHSGKCIDVWDSSQDPTADATQYTCSADKLNQQFLVEHTGTGTIKLRARHSFQCLDIAGRNFNNKSKLHQMPCDSHRAQQWVIG